MKTCKDCGQPKPLTEFWFSHHRYPYSYCKDCYRLRNKLYARRWRAAYPEKYNKAVERIRFSKYGMTQQEYLQLWKRQKGVCALCGIELGRGRICIDHDHKTLQIRGLLCQVCNLLIALLDKDILFINKAISYCKLDHAEV